MVMSVNLDEKETEETVTVDIAKTTGLKTVDMTMKLSRRLNFVKRIFQF